MAHYLWTEEETDYFLQVIKEKIIATIGDHKHTKASASLVNLAERTTTTADALYTVQQ